MSSVFNTEKVIYSDVDINFAPNWDRDVAQKINSRAVMQSVINIVTTKKGSMPFDPDYGTTLGSEMFDNITPFLMTTIENDVYEALKAYEPRVTDINVKLRPSDNDLHTIEVTVTFRTVYDVGESGFNTVSFTVDHN